MLHRRELLKSLFSAAVSAPWLAWSAADATDLEEKNEKQATVRQYRTLGSTGLEVSDIGFGVAVSTDPKLLVEAYARGINFYDVVPFYSWSVDMLSRAFALSPEMKKKAIVASKAECKSIFDNWSMFSGDFHKAGLKCVDQTLRKLGREQIDILQLHSVGEDGAESLDLLDPNTERGSQVASLFESLKKQGKVRFVGLTSHGPRLLETVVRRAMDAGRFDMMMVALNFMHSPSLKSLLEEAQSRSFGMVAMKALANAKNLKIKTPEGRPFSQAAIAWALAQPAVASVAITIQNKKQLEEYLGSSGRSLSYADRVALLSHRILTSPDYCRVGCGECQRACPQGVDIPTVLRIDQYRSDYGLGTQARERYQDLSHQRRPDVCEQCNDEHCRRACPFGIRIRPRLLAAKQALGAPRGRVT